MNGKLVAFNDSKKLGDRIASDGIFSAIVPLAFGKLLSDQITGIQAPEQTIKSALSFPMFNGREVVDDAQRKKLLEATLSDARQLSTLKQLQSLQSSLPIITTSGLLEKVGVNPATQPLFEISLRADLKPFINILGINQALLQSVAAQNISVPHSLMITNVKVVEDPKRTFDICTGKGTRGGVWTFSYLMKQLSLGTGMAPEDYAMSWLKTWLTNQNINTFDVLPRPNMEAIIETWRLASAPSGKEFDIDYFPARFMAFVNRPDAGNSLDGTSGGYGNDDGLRLGEARLVFALLDSTGTLNSDYGRREKCDTVPFTVIFEYNTPAKTCATVKSWQTRWKKLDQYVLGSATYNSALASMTTSFTNYGKNPNQLPNKNLLAQLRTNENALDKWWELREFVLENKADGVISSSGELLPDTVKQNPDLRFNKTDILADFVVNYWSILGIPTFHKVPLEHSGMAFRAGSALVVPDQTFYWYYDINSYPQPMVPSTPSEARHVFSRNTCNGCHAGETKTEFTHIGDLSAGLRAAGTEAALSKFLTGKSSVTNLTASPFNYWDRFDSADGMNDPSGNSWPIAYNDLAHRQDVMADILNTPCKLIDFAPDLPFVQSIDSDH